MERRDRETHDDVAHYKTLGVDTHASEREIAKAYRRAALEWHPDKHAHKSEKPKSPQKCSFASTKPSKPSAVDDSRNVKNICILQTVYETLEKFQPTLKIFIHLLIRRFQHSVAKSEAWLQLRLLRTESVPLILTGRDARTL